MILRISLALRKQTLGLGKYFNQPSGRHYFEGKFTDESKSKILRVLNDFGQPNELSKYSITQANCKKLMKQRKEIGSYENLEDALNALNPKVVEKFYKSIIEGGRPIAFGSSAMNPNLTPQIKARASKVLSISTMGSTIAWSLIERQGKEDPIILTLEGVRLEEVAFKPRTHFLAVLNRMKGVVSSLPEADLYVFEEPASMVPTAQQVPYALQSTQIRSFLMGLLSGRYEESAILSIKTLAIARMFQLHVGTEKVSGQTVVENLLSTKDHFKISEVIRWDFLNADDTRREHLANAVLLNIAYWKLSNQF